MEKNTEELEIGQATINQHPVDQNLDIQPSSCESQLDSIKEDDEDPPQQKSSELNEIENRIIKELKNVRRQNLITHCLLSAMIVLTVAWQVGEVSLILKVKNGLSNPFKSVAGIIAGFFPARSSTLPEIDFQEAMNKVTGNRKKNGDEQNGFSKISGKIDELLPQLDLPGFSTTSEED